MPLSNRFIWPTLGCVLVNAQLAFGLAAAVNDHAVMAAAHEALGRG